MNSAYQDWEVGNAQLLVEQAWNDVDGDKTFEAIRSFFASAYVSQDGFSLNQTSLIRCDRCRRPLYRVKRERFGVCVLSAEECNEALLGQGGLMTRRPVVFTCGARQIIVCSKRCASDWFLSSDPSELAGGYPL